MGQQNIYEGEQEVQSSLHVWNSLMHHYTTGTDCLSSNVTEKDSKGVTLDVNLNIRIIFQIRKSSAARLK